MNDPSIEAKVSRLITEYAQAPVAGGSPATSLDHNLTLRGDLAIDSLAIMDMVMELEDRFDISIPMNVVAEIHTVDELADTILKLAARR